MVNLRIVVFLLWVRYRVLVCSILKMVWRVVCVIMLIVVWMVGLLVTMLMVKLRKSSPLKNRRSVAMLCGMFKVRKLRNGNGMKSIVNRATLRSGTRVGSRRTIVLIRMVNRRVWLLFGPKMVRRVYWLTMLRVVSKVRRIRGNRMVV